MIARKRKTPRREDEGEEEEEMDDDLEKRRRGARDVWDVIVKMTTIFVSHTFLPRLNRTDVKFLYGVNTETRKLVKRSSRKGDLKKKFEVRRDVVDIDFGSCVGESIVVAESLERNEFLRKSCWNE